MKTHFYLSLSPVEALIASQLEPLHFGQYMAIGAKNGSYERIMFLEIEGGFGDFFDWEYARERCIAHSDGSPKHSVWLGIYRVLEHTPLSAMGTLYLTTKDGRTLPIEKSTPRTPPSRSYYVYQELCPLTPLVVSVLPPARFAESLISTTNPVSVPAVVFSDLKVIDFDNPEATGNIGGLYDHNIDHLKACVHDVTTKKDKPNKNVERSVGSFSYQIIRDGTYIAGKEGLIEYTMPSVEVIRRDHYDWGRSALIL